MYCSRCRYHQMWKCCQPQHDFTTASPFPTPLSWQLKHSYHKIKHKSWLNFFFIISTRHQFQNLDQTSASRLNLEFKILTKPKHQQQNTDQTPASNLAWTSTFKFLTEPCTQSLNKSSAFWPNLSFQICNKLLPTRSSSATVSTSTSFELASSHARVTSIKFTKRYGVSQWVS